MQQLAKEALGFVPPPMILPPHTNSDQHVGEEEDEINAYQTPFSFGTYYSSTNGLDTKLLIFQYAYSTVCGCIISNVI